MSDAAEDLLELVRLSKRGDCQLTKRRLREVALNIIAAGVEDYRAGL